VLVKMRVERAAGGLRIFDAEVGEGVYELLLEQGLDGEVYLVSMGEGCTSLTRWDVETGDMVWRVRESFFPLNSLATVPLPDGRVLLAGGEFIDFMRWDARTGTLLSTYEYGGSVYSVASGPLPSGGTLMVGAGDVCDVLRWDAATGEVLPPLEGHDDVVRAVAVLPIRDGAAVIVSGDQMGVIRCWDAESGLPVGDPVDAHEDIIYILKPVPLPDGTTLLVSADRLGVMRWWDTETWQQVYPAADLGEENISSVDVAVFDGRVSVFTAGGDGQVREWDAETGRVVSVLRKGNKVASLARADGTLVVASADLTDIVITTEARSHQMPSDR
jgi:WD40 repeat protein